MKKYMVNVLGFPWQEKNQEFLSDFQFCLHFCFKKYLKRNVFMSMFSCSLHFLSEAVIGRSGRVTYTVAPLKGGQTGGRLKFERGQSFNHRRSKNPTSQLFPLKINLRRGTLLCHVGHFYVGAGSEHSPHPSHRAHQGLGKPPLSLFLLFSSCPDFFKVYYIQLSPYISVLLFENSGKRVSILWPVQ